MRLHTVVSTDDSLYQWWQAEALWDSFQNVGQPGRFSALVASGTRGKTIRPFRCPHQTTAQYACQRGDRYQVYNKPGSICEWLSRESPLDETILLLDPDCLFIKPLERFAERGRPVSQYIHYMEVDNCRARHLISRYCRRNRGLMRPVGIPTLIHAEDLRLIGSRWCELTFLIRHDATGIPPERRASEMWISDMWAFNIAMAEAGLQCDVADNLCQWSIEDVDNRPILHYCYPTRYDASGSVWDKRYYRPWTSPPDSSLAAARGAKLLMKEISRIAAKQGFAVAG